MHALSIKISDDLYHQLETEISKRHMTKSQLIRVALEKILSSDFQSDEFPSFYTLSKDLCGSVAGGPGDISSNPEHMEGYGE